jgi:DNA-binding response OmpR family regulator
MDYGLRPALPVFAAAVRDFPMQPNPRPEADAAPANQSPPMILVVEDHNDIRNRLALALREFGFAVREASTGEAAVDIFRTVRIDFVLMDLQLPDTDGLKTLAAMQDIDPQIVCCFMSFAIDSVFAKQLVRMGAFAALQKPFQLSELRRLIVEAVSRK